MTLLASLCVAMGRVFEPGPVLSEDLAHPHGIEVAQIQRHLAEVEATLRQTPPPGATPEVMRARADILDALHAYWTAGEFPKNRDFPGRRVPYFIDADGTACAVGHLMIASGDAAMAREIATYENHDYVADIDHPGLGAWLARNGLTADEAAWIQPAYDSPCFMDTNPRIACGTDGRTYACEQLAAQCSAGVQVESLGYCPGDGAGDVIESCSTESPGEDSGGTDASGEESGTDDEDDSGKGCRMGDSPSASILFLLLALVRRRNSL